MFAPRYFAQTYYPARYFPPGAASVPASPAIGGFRQVGPLRQPTVVHASLILTLPELKIWAYASVDEDDIATAILELL